MYDPILTLNFVRCFRDKLPWWLLAQDELLAATITKLVCWVRLTKAKLWGSTVRLVLWILRTSFQAYLFHIKRNFDLRYMLLDVYLQ